MTDLERVAEAISREQCKHLRIDPDEMVLAGDPIGNPAEYPQWMLGLPWARQIAQAAIAAWNDRPGAAGAETAGDLREAVEKIVDPDAWHESLPTDGCGSYWHSRRNKARSKADLILALLSARQPLHGATVEACADIAKKQAEWERAQIPGLKVQREIMAFENAAHACEMVEAAIRALGVEFKISPEMRDVLHKALLASTTHVYDIEPLPTAPGDAGK